jgi:hypothetical protein
MDKEMPAPLHYECTHLPHKPAAFPAGITSFPNLTKRELFAAMAMQGLLSDGNQMVALMKVADGNGTEAIMMARCSIHFADALIAELNK